MITTLLSTAQWLALDKKTHSHFWFLFDLFLLDIIPSVARLPKEPDLWSTGHGFESRPPHYRLQPWASCLHTCTSVVKQYNLVPSNEGWCSAAGEVTAGLAESNGSLPPGLGLRPPVGWLPRTGISSGILYYFWVQNYLTLLFITLTLGQVLQGHPKEDWTGLDWIAGSGFFYRPNALPTVSRHQRVMTDK